MYYCIQHFGEFYCGVFRIAESTFVGKWPGHETISPNCRPMSCRCWLVTALLGFAHGWPPIHTMIKEMIWCKHPQQEKPKWFQMFSKPGFLRCPLSKSPASVLKLIRLVPDHNPWPKVLKWANKSYHPSYKTGKIDKNSILKTSSNSIYTHCLCPDWIKTWKTHCQWEWRRQAEALAALYADGLQTFSPWALGLCVSHGSKWLDHACECVWMHVYI